MTLRTRLLKAHPAMLVLGSFLLAMILGMLLLKLPAASRNGRLDWIDAMFTATSAVCVTGLVVVDTGGHFTRFGQGVILGLIQIGGLGVMTLSVILFRWIGKTVSFRQRMVMQDLFAPSPREDIFSLVKSTLLFTFGAELAGTALLTVHWCREFPLPRALYVAVFHSVSAFCNAGFALFPDSMTRYSDNVLLNLTLCGLIVLGGIGFPVLYDLQSRFAEKRPHRRRLSVQTKTVLLTTFILIALGAGLFILLEPRPHVEAASLSHRLLVSLFQSVTCRTAGFNTVDIGGLSNATLALMIFLMFYGASPGSCGGGVKTTTLALLAAFTTARIRKHKRVNLFKKSIPDETVTRSMSLVLVSIGIICTILFMLLAGEPTTVHAPAVQERPFLAYLFETVSAFGTVGLSMGATPDLNSWDKGWIILMMIIGRVGVLTFAYIVVGSGATSGVAHAEENLMIG